MHTAGSGSLGTGNVGSPISVKLAGKATRGSGRVVAHGAGQTQGAIIAQSPGIEKAEGSKKLTLAEEIEQEIIQKRIQTAQTEGNYMENGSLKQENKNVIQEVVKIYEQMIKTDKKLPINM